MRYSAPIPASSAPWSGAHIFESLSEGHHRVAHALKVLHHLHRSPTVERDLSDVVSLAELADEGLDESVVDHVAFGGLYVAGSFPYVVGNMITPHTQAQAVLGYPEPGEDHEFVMLIPGWEYEHEGGDVGGRREIQSAVTDPALELLGIDREVAQVPFLHRHPANSLLDPLVEPELTEHILLARVLPCAVTGRLHLLEGDGMPQRRVGFLPRLRIGPVVVLLRAVDHRVEGLVVFATFDDVLGLLVLLVADGVLVGACRGDQEEQRLGTRIARALGHDIEELAVGLGVQFVEDDPMDVEPVFGVGLCAQHLVEAVGRQVHDALGGGENLHASIQRGTHAHHVRCHFEYDRCLLPVGCTPVDLGAFLEVPTGEQQCHRGGELALSVLLGNLDVGGVELPISIGLDDTEQVADDSLLPGKQLEGLSSPNPLGVAEAFDEPNCTVGQGLVVGRFLCHEGCRGVFLRFRHNLFHSSGQTKRTRRGSLQVVGACCQLYVSFWLSRACLVSVSRGLMSQPRS